MAKRHEPKDPTHAGLVFVTKYGEGWSKDVADSPVTKEFRKLLDATGINGHRNFYALRHTFRTIADEAKDQPAADHVMGHESPNMSSVYRERISDERLRAVSEHVHRWLFGGVQYGNRERRESPGRLARRTVAAHSRGGRAGPAETEHLHVRTAV